MMSDIVCEGCHKALQNKAVVYALSPTGDEAKVLCGACADKLESVRLPRNDLFEEKFGESLKDARDFDDVTAELLRQKFAEIRKENGTVVKFPGAVH